MNFYEQQRMNAWYFKINGLQATIKIEAKDMWMEVESLTNWIHLFRSHWPYKKSKILLNCVDHLTLRYYGRPISLTKVIDDLVLEYNTHSILHSKIVYDYSSLFSKNYYANNLINVKQRF